MSEEPKPYYAREPRSDLRLPAKLYFDGREGTGELINISLSGGFLQIDDLPDAYTVLAMSVTPPVGDPLFFHASVIRSETLADGHAGCAVKFLNLTPETEGRLAYLIKRKATSNSQG
jgi:hypothetical protein